MSERLPLNNWFSHKDHFLDHLLFAKAEESSSQDVSIFLPKEQKDTEHLELFEPLVKNQDQPEEQKISPEEDCIKLCEKRTECEITTILHHLPSSSIKIKHLKQGTGIALKPNKVKTKKISNWQSKNFEKKAEFERAPKENKRKIKKQPFLTESDINYDSCLDDQMINQ